jgi:hypothetical protein
MDIAYYISDLLGHQGEVTVPNLGYFVQIRMPAHYDAKAKKFFPPHYSVQFDPQVVEDDDSLANHISEIKKISPSSAKYFIEKYTGNLKSDAIVDEVAFANLGTFTSDGVKLTFTSAVRNNDPAFFAYQPLTAFKIGEAKTKPVQSVEPVFAGEEEEEMVAAPATPFNLFGDTANAESEAGLQETEEEEEVYEKEPKRFGVWIIVLIAFTVLIIALGALYKFKPTLFKFLKHQDSYVVPTPSPALIKKDTQADSAKIQTTAKTDSLKADTPKVTTPVQKPAETKPVETKQPNKAPEAVVNKPAENKKPDVVVAQAPVSTAPPVNTPVANTPTNSLSATDVVPKGTWLIYSQAFPTRAGADKRVLDLKAKGFSQARLLTDKVFSGGNYKVILGVYKSRAEAMDAKHELLSTGKLTEADFDIEPYK